MPSPMARPSTAGSSLPITAVPVSLTRDAMEAEDELTPYELARAEQLKRNRARLAALDLPAAAAALAPAPKAGTVKAATKGVGARKRREPEPLGPRRASSRLQGLQSDGAYIVEEKARGKGLGLRARITIAAPNAAAAAAGATVEVVPEDEEEDDGRHPGGPVPFTSENGGRGMDEAFLDVLRRAAAPGGGGSGGGGAAAPRPPQAGPAPASTSAACPPVIARSALAERDVAKVTWEGVVHLAFHPTADREGNGGSGGAPRLLLAAGSKAGRVSLWDVDWSAADADAAAAAVGASPPPAAAAAEEGGPGDADDAAPSGGAAAGVLEFAPHRAYVSGLAWAPGGGAGSTLFTASYDGSVRSLDASVAGASSPAACFAPALLHADAEFSAFDVAWDAAWGVAADKDGVGWVFDPRSGGVPAPGEGEEPADPTAGSRGAVVSVVALGDRKVNCLSIDKDGAGHMLAASFSDGAVRVYDVRALGGGRPPSAAARPAPKKAAPARPLATGGHAQTVQGCYFAPDGSGRLLTTSRDDTLGVWRVGEGGGEAKKKGGGGGGGGCSRKHTAPESVGLARLATARHNNNTGRWIIPFRAIWTPPAWGADAVAVGGMHRTIDFFEAGTGKACASLRSPDFMTAIPSRLACHPRVGGVVAGATASGRINVFRHPA